MDLKNDSKTGKKGLEYFEGVTLLMGNRDAESQDWETSFKNYSGNKEEGLRLYMDYWGSARKKIEEDSIDSSKLAEKLSFYDSAVEKLL